MIQLQNLSQYQNQYRQKLQKKMQSEDKQIRQRQKQKDIDLSKQLQKQMRVEQEMLKDYFRQYKKPIKDDPTIVKKQKKAEDQDKTKIYKEAFRPFKIFGMFYDFWTMQCATAQQKYALKNAKNNIKSNVFTYLSISLLITSVTSYKTRMYLGVPMHIFGFVTAIASGSFLGIINSTQYTLEQFEKLGEGYQLGRMAIAQIQQYRMDKAV